MTENIYTPLAPFVIAIALVPSEGKVKVKMEIPRSSGIRSSGVLKALFPATLSDTFEDTTIVEGWFIKLEDGLIMINEVKLYKQSQINKITQNGS